MYCFESGEWRLVFVSSSFRGLFRGRKLLESARVDPGGGGKPTNVTQFGGGGG